MRKLGHLVRNSWLKRPSAKIGLGLLLAVALGSLFGIGTYTFHYGEGLSYFSKDPKACMNCHIMEPQFNSWQKASHHGVATCVDCHLPHDFIPKLIAKAENGYFHSKGFTFLDFHEPIMIKEKNIRILQQNCLHCHDQITHDLVSGATTDRDAVSCLHCHRSVGHGDSTGLGGYDTSIHSWNKNL